MTVTATAPAQGTIIREIRGFSLDLPIRILVKKFYSRPNPVRIEITSGNRLLMGINCDHWNLADNLRLVENEFITEYC